MGFRQSIRDAVGRAVCRLSQPDAIGSFFGIPGSGVLFPDSVDAFREWVCDVPSDGGQSILRPGSPGIGGQCPVDYDVSYEEDRFFPSSNTSDTLTRVRRVRGPVQGIRFENPNSTQSFVYIQHNNTETLANSESFSNRQTTGVRIVSVARVDGQPDECGFLQEPELPSIEDTIPPEEPGQPDRPIVIAPRFPINLPGGGIQWPININGPNFNFDSLVRIGGGGAGGGGGGGDCDPVQPIFGPRSRTEPIGSENIPEAGENEPPEPPEGDESGTIIGCIVTVTGRANATATVIGGVAGFPELLIPRIADVSFAVTIDGKQAWTADIPVKFDKQWIPVPGRLLAYDVRIKPEPGVNALFFPLRVTEEFKLEAGLL